MAGITVVLGENEYTSIFIHRANPDMKSCTIRQTGKGELIIEYDHKRIFDEREQSST